MPLATEVGLGPVDIVLYGEPSTPPQKGGLGNSTLQFSAHVYCELLLKQLMPADAPSKESYPPGHCLVQMFYWTRFERDNVGYEEVTSFRLKSLNINYSKGDDGQRTL